MSLFHFRQERGVEGDGQGISQPLQNDFMRFVLSPRLTTWIELCPKRSIAQVGKLFALEATKIQGKLDINGYTYGFFT